MNWTGQCLCGAVTFAASGRARVAHECHCRNCRRWSGHVWAYVTVEWAALRFARDDGLHWYRHTARARRGFCGACGSVLFWQPEGSPRVDVSAGALDAPTGLRLGADSYPQFKGDYYDLGCLR